MSDFAKLFATPIGQVLVVFDPSGSGDGAPQINFSIMPEDFGLCSTKITFKDSDEGSAEAQKVLNLMTEQAALLALKPLLESLDVFRTGDCDEHTG